MKSKVSGKFAMGQCGGWKNTAKTSLIALMINVEYMVRTDSRILFFVIYDWCYD